MEDKFYRKFLEAGGLDSIYYTYDLEKLCSYINSELNYKLLGIEVEDIELRGYLTKDDSITYELKFTLSRGCSCELNLETMELEWDKKPLNAKSVEDVIIDNTDLFYTEDEEYCCYEDDEDETGEYTDESIYDELDDSDKAVIDDSLLIFAELFKKEETDKYGYIDYMKERMSEVEENNNCKVNKPNHYKLANGLEVIEIIKMLGSTGDFEAYCKGNVIKYLTRYKLKNGVEDLQKAKKYIDFLIEVEESKELI